MSKLKRRKFDKLKVIRMLPDRQNGNCVWLCRCKCGNLTKATTAKLNNGHKTSCGCARQERARALQRFGVDHHSWKGVGELSGSVWNRIRACAKQRNKTFTIDIDYAWSLYEAQKGRCRLSGAKLYLAKSSKDLLNGKNTASLDRIDSSKGYEAGNVQWVHVIVNYMKQGLQEDIFIDWCRLVADHASSVG